MHSESDYSFSMEWLSRVFRFIQRAILRGVEGQMDSNEIYFLFV